ncbi:MAG: single-stranded DNA-binding protein [Erysipelothrix sp.]|nr:single-stranded DNA-binding protein [Erysipelothrix sp.]
MNSLTLVGVLKKYPELEELKNGKKQYRFIVEAEKNFRNEDGSIEKELYECIIWRGIADTIISVCEEGQLLGIRGRLQPKRLEINENGPVYAAEIVAEKISILETREG